MGDISQNFNIFGGSNRTYKSNSTNDLVESEKPIDSIKSVGSINWSLVSKPKFLMKLVLIRICILVPCKSFCGTFYYTSLITSSKARWNFSYDKFEH